MDEDTQVYEIPAEPVRKTFNEWNEGLVKDETAPFYVLDPDGFDRSEPDFWERTYTWEDFERRAMSSTCMIRRNNG